MREIKFRAWDKKRKGFITDCDIHFDLEGHIEIDVWGPEDETGYEEYICSYEEKDFILMQYIDKKDKNGVEIFEGDICIQHDYPFYSEGLCNYRGVVEWFSVDACWYLELYVVSDRVRGAACGGMLSEYPQIEVIGNIYENPELL